MKIELANNVECAAFAVILGEMGFDLEGVGELEGKWCVITKNPVPPEVLTGIMLAMRKDQQNDPKKWQEALNQPPKHPNLSPVRCKSVDDIRALAAVMKVAASKDPDHVPEYEGSKTEFEAHMRGEDVGMMMVERGLNRFMLYEGYPIVLCLTLQVDGGKKYWNFSTSIVRQSQHDKPGRVPDEIIAVVVPAFIGEGYEEVEPKAVWKTVRHFVKEYSDEPR